MRDFSLSQTSPLNGTDVLGGRDLQLVAKDGCAQPIWEGAQAPVMRVLICYFLLLVSNEHKLSLFKGAVRCERLWPLRRKLQVSDISQHQKINLEK